LILLDFLGYLSPRRDQRRIIEPALALSPTQ
jgi:hypothetical protein